MNSRSFFILFSILVVIGSCARLTTQKPAGTPTQPPPPTPQAYQGCELSQEDHLIFSILIDGKDVGREVRTTSIIPSSTGPIHHVSSHKFTRMKIGSARYEKREIRKEKTDPSGRLLGASYVNLDQLSSQSIQITYDGSSYMRHIESSSEMGATSAFNSNPLKLSGGEVIGFNLVNHLRKRTVSPTGAQGTVLFYEPIIPKPVKLRISKPKPGTIVIDGQDIHGHWTEATRMDTQKIAVRVFFDDNGSPWVEQYPELYQEYRRLPGSLTLSMDTSELLVGLHSEAYISDPNAATRAVFRIQSTPDRLKDALPLLTIPLNHRVQRISPKEVHLEVTADSPDGNEPPTPEDLSTSPYVQPKSPEIMGAYRYLRSAGKRGVLSQQRKYNATRVIARAGLVRYPSRFWKDPDKVAGLTMHYVSALLPDKNHTFSMADSITTLAKGSGDCTEHAVLFAALMRAADVPTRLVSGMKLNPGGMWGYHMWNEYWNGNEWQSIDSSSMAYRPGAMYVALGRGAPKFSDVRDRLDVFMKRVFFGVSIDLIEATNNGESLFLARPRSPGQNLRETALLNAVVLSQRGDHKGAINILDDNISGDRRTLPVKMMRIELLVLDGRHEEALSRIRTLRRETPNPHNFVLLDRFELRCLLSMGLEDEADAIFKRIDADFLRNGEEVRRSLLQAEYFFGLGDPKKSVVVLEDALNKNRDDVSLLTAYADYVSISPVFDAIKLQAAFWAATRAVDHTLAMDHNALTVLARIHLKLGRPVQALRVVDHALILAPASRKLHDLRKEAGSAHCSPN